MLLLDRVKNSKVHKNFIFISNWNSRSNKMQNTPTKKRVRIWLENEVIKNYRVLLEIFFWKQW